MRLDGTVPDVEVLLEADRSTDTIFPLKFEMENVRLVEEGGISFLAHEQHVASDSKHIFPPTAALLTERIFRIVDSVVVVVVVVVVVYSKESIRFPGRSSFQEIDSGSSKKLRVIRET